MPKKTKTQTESRKKEHIELVIKNGGQYCKTSGLERIDFMHNALPEISLDSVDLSIRFLNKTLSYPIIITGMTGGYGDAENINKSLAAAAQKYSLAFGVGSQRAMLEKPELVRTYKIRDVAPDIPLLANIGAYQLKSYPLEKIESLVEAIEADALAVHLNILQEVIQPEGDTDFSGVLDAIRRTSERLSVPVIAKETGAGISQDVALKLKDAGVEWLDIAGAGGTSWSRVEYMRAGIKPKKSTQSEKGGVVPGFEDWGIPTAECIMQCRGILPLIASGGIRNGLDGAKAIALGADLCGGAYPFMQALAEKKLDNYIETFQKQMRICAFLTGSRTLAELKKAKLIIR